MNIQNKYVYIKDSAGELIGYVHSSTNEEIDCGSSHLQYDVIWIKLFASRNNGEEEWDVSSKGDVPGVDPTIITLNLTKYQRDKTTVKIYDTYEELVGEYFDALL